MKKKTQNALAELAWKLNNETHQQLVMAADVSR